MVMKNYEISALRLTNFRNYPHIAFEPKPGLNVITGSNGVGKTNLLEAISLLIPGRGIRNAAKREIGRFYNQQQNCWGVLAAVEDGLQQTRISTGLEQVGANRKVLINSAAARQTDLSHVFNAIWLSPLQDRLFVDGLTERRRFLDRLVFGLDAQHAGRVASYEKSLRERAKLLFDHNFDDAWLCAIEQKIAKKGIAIAAARLDVVKRLNNHLTQQTHDFPKALLSVDGDVEIWLQNLSAIEAEDLYIQRLKDTRQSDAKSTNTEIGSHRSGFNIYHLERHMPAQLCSTGEQKALLISIIFANAQLQGEEKGVKPVLLLDEVTAHLDPDRRAHLFHELYKHKMQVFMTGTESSLFVQMPPQTSFWQVVDNQILQY